MYILKKWLTFFKRITRFLHENKLESDRVEYIKNLIKKRSFKTAFQPIVSLAQGQIVGHEILNRPPDDELFEDTECFYDFLGETDLVFSYEAAARQESISRFSAQTEISDARLFINVHPNVLNDVHYIQGITRKMLKKIGMKPEQITFEITEKQVVNDYDHLRHTLEHYRKQGFSIAIDDVGAGYNSLRTMLKVKPDFIKLDRSLIRKIDQDLDQQALVKLFVDYAERTGSIVIAEGIEERQEFEVVHSLGILYGQGYLFAKPEESVIHKLDQSLDFTRQEIVNLS